jgi:penicillin-binding protein 1A
VAAASRSNGARERRRRRIRKLRLLVVVALLLLLSAASFTFGLVTAIAGEIPPLDPARHHAQADGYIYANDGKRILAVLRGSESRVIVGSEQISPAMKQAIIAVEDRRFEQHQGVDIRGIARAFWADVQHKSVVEGGSTITQQFVKNAYVHDERSIARKLKEAALAWQLESGPHRWSKDKILTAYLNTIYFGNGAYGVQQASKTYFGHGAQKLTLPEAALLAGIPQDPARYDPVTNPTAARARRLVVLRDMLEQLVITRQQFRDAARAPLPKPEDVRLPGTEGPAQYFVNYVKQQLVDAYGARKVFGGGLRVTTTIDLDLQRLAREAIADTLTEANGPSAALVAIEPQTGRVVAMVGGNNYRRSQFNLAVQGERQPGSSFKPFVLATALRQGISPSSTFVSKPVTLYAGGTFWAVNNYEDEYLGPIDLEAATIHSDNSVYAQLTRVVGPANVVRTAHALGIKSKLRSYFAIGLGAEAVNPLEMARAFATFGNDGLRVDGSIFENEPRAILTVGVGKKRPDVNLPDLHRAVTPEVAEQVTGILEGVIREGTGRRAALADGRPAAGKTGTTENYGDAWFVGYTPQLAVAVWVGYPNKLRPMLTEYHGDPVAGGTFPAEIWKTFMDRVIAREKWPAESFPSPSFEYAAPKRVVWRDGRLQVDNGNCHLSAEVLFVENRGPTKVANCKPNEVDVPHVVGSKVADAELRLQRQPLSPVIVYKPAAPLQRTDIVIAQYPRRGRLSSYDKVTLVVARPLHGRIPRVVGLPLRVARAKLRAVKASPLVTGLVDGPAGHVVSQAPPPGVAAGPGISVRLVVGRG